MKKQYDLKPCPFCGNPAEIVKGEPFSFAPYKLTYVVRCSSEWCLIGSSITCRYGTKQDAIADWNYRRKRNKLTCDEKGYPIKEKQEDN